MSWSMMLPCLLLLLAAPCRGPHARVCLDGHQADGPGLLRPDERAAYKLLCSLLGAMCVAKLEIFSRMRQNQVAESSQHRKPAIQSDAPKKARARGRQTACVQAASPTSALRGAARFFG